MITDPLANQAANHANPPLFAKQICVERSGRSVLVNFDLCAAQGSVIALAGPNGAGKSTALKALAGLLPCSSGSLRVFGRELRELSLRERARQLAYVPQQSLLQSGIAARDVVSQGRYAHVVGWPAWRNPVAPAVERAMRATHVDALADRRWDELSGGEQRRVLLARALATEASIVLLDEPTASLDVAHAIRFLGLLRKLAGAGQCIVVVLHDLQQVRRYADSAILLDRGRVVATGSAREVIATEFIRQVYDVELEENSALGFRLLEPGVGDQA
jgi:iron complex transport system ATP-binding protein